MAITSRPRVFLDVNIGAEPCGRLIIELFTDKTPKTCENFRQLCTNSDPALSYAMSPFHRIIDEFMIQGGDITAGNGIGGKSIYNNGGEFEDENLGWRDLDAAGLVCMANRGKDTNSSQFFITLEPCPHLNGKHTVFGHLVVGRDVLEKMSKVKVDDDDKPFDPVLIAKCGELERRKKTAPPHRVSPERVNQRGRKRDDSISPSPSKERERSPVSTDKRKRRQSDNHIDENLRGRPRARSDDESAASDAVSSGRQSRSPAMIHERKRSPSPHRMPVETDRVDKDGEGQGYERRRRRSLPNQYDEGPLNHRRDSERRDRHGDRHRSRDGKRDDRRGGPRDWDDPRSHERQNDRRDDPRGKGGYGRRRNDNYRPNRNGRLDDGRLGGDGRLAGGENTTNNNDSGIKFKGRGSMKYREPDRRW